MLWLAADWRAHDNHNVRNAGNLVRWAASYLACLGQRGEVVALAQPAPDSEDAPRDLTEVPSRGPPVMAGRF